MLFGKTNYTMFHYSLRVIDEQNMSEIKFSTCADRGSIFAESHSYILSVTAAYLKVHVQNQTSEIQKGEPSIGYCATALLDYKSVVGSYDYAVYINTT